VQGSRCLRETFTAGAPNHLCKNPVPPVDGVAMAVWSHAPPIGLTGFVTLARRSRPCGWGWHVEVGCKSTQKVWNRDRFGNHFFSQRWKRYKRWL